MRILATAIFLPAALVFATSAWAQGYGSGYSYGGGTPDAPLETSDDFQEPVAQRGVSLGALRVISAPTEPLRAEIPIYGLSVNQIGGFTAVMADEAAYERAGLAYDPLLSNIHIQSEISALTGEPVLVLTTESPVDRPALELLLEAKLNVAGLSQNYGQIYRPLIFAGMGPEEWTGTEAPTLSDTDDAPKTVRKPSRTRSSRATGARGDLYTVRAGDTLSGIALKHLPEGVDFEQMLAALYSHNRKALTLSGPMGHPMHHLRKGMQLVIPTPEQAQQRNRHQAWVVDEPGYLAFNEYRRKLSSGELSAPQNEAEGRVSPTQNKTGKDRLTLGRSPTHGRDSSANAQNQPATHNMPPLQIVVPEGIYAKSSDFEEVRRQLTELSGGIQRLSDNVTDIKNRPAQASGSASGAAAGSQASGPALSRGTLQTLADYGPFLVVGLLISILIALVRFLVRALRGTQTRKNAKSVQSVQLGTPSSAAPADEGYAQPEYTPAPQVPTEEEVQSAEPAVEQQALSEPVSEYAAQIDSAVLSEGEPAAMEELQPPAEPPLSESEVQIDLAAGGDEEGKYDPLRDDPIQQAELHLRLGEDSRAEGVLIEGMGNFPDRLDIRRRLLDYYAQHQDAPAFEQVAQRLYELTGGQGEAWEAAATQGRELDPSNPFYAVDASAQPSAHSESEPALSPELSPEGKLSESGQEQPTAAMGDYQEPGEGAAMSESPAVGAAEISPSLGSLGPADEETQLGLAEEFLAIGNTDEARQILEELLGSNSTEVQSRAHEMLNRLN